MGDGPVEITPKVTADLLSQSLALRQELRDLYRLLPETRSVGGGPSAVPCCRK
jgi:hypothetical protein